MENRSTAPPRPQLIVVAGSAGRSSIAGMIAAMLTACGGHVVQVSDHYLHSPLERIAVDGRPVEPNLARSLLAQYTRAEDPPEQRVQAIVRPLLDQTGAEWLVLSGAAHPEESAAVLVLAPILPEAGAGASDIATAICRDLPAAPVAVSAPQRESALDVLRPALPGLVEVAQRCRLSRGRADLDGQEFRLRTDALEYRLHLPVLGSFQIENAATAILALEQLKPFGVELTPAAARSGLELLRLPGRLEVLKRRPLVVVDAGATAAAIRRAAETLRELSGGRRLSLILDCSAGSEAAVAMPVLTPLGPEVIGAGPAAASELADACYEAGLPLQRAPDIGTALDQALERSRPDDALAVMGSRAAAAAARSLLLGLMPDDLPVN